MFKKGQKVTFKPVDDLPFHPLVRVPDKNDILTVIGPAKEEGYSMIEGYPFQSFSNASLHPIKEDEVFVKYSKVLKEVPVIAN